MRAPLARSWLTWPSSGCIFEARGVSACQLVCSNRTAPNDAQELEVQTGADRNNCYPHCGACEPDFTNSPVGFAVQPVAESAFRGPTLNHESRKSQFVVYRLGSYCNCRS